MVLGVGFGVLMTVAREIAVLWEMTPCNLVDRYHSLGESCCLDINVRTVYPVQQRMLLGNICLSLTLGFYAA
jgi:hypothetical protein